MHRGRHLERIGLDVGEVEGLAPRDRAADGGAEAVVLVVALGTAGLLVEVVRRVEVGAAEPLVDLAAQAVGAALGHQVDRRAHGVADRGVVGRRRDLELLHRRRGRAVGDAVGGDVGHAVDGEVVALLTGAVARPLREAVVEGGLARAQVGRVLDAWREDDELDRGAFADRQLGDPAGVDDLPEAGRRGIDHGGGGADGHLVGDPSWLQRGVHVQHLGDVQVDVLADELAETVERDGDAIGSGVEERHTEVALLVRGRRRADAGCDVGDFHGRTRHDRSARIGHSALQRATRLLRPGQRGPGGDQAHGQGRDDPRFHQLPPFELHPRRSCAAGQHPSFLRLIDMSKTDHG